MERYFFDVFNGNGLEVDENGQQLRSAEHMRELAISTLTRIANEEFPVSQQRRIEIRVRKNDGTNVFSAVLSLQTSDTAEASD